MDISPFELSLQELSEILSRHVTNQSFFRELQFCTYIRKTIEKNCYGKNLRRINFDECLFDETNISRAGFSGSRFYKCIFRNVNFRGSNLNQCKFINCSFFGNIFGANFDDSYFVDTVLECEKIKDTNFSNAQFKNCVFKSEIWISNFLENAHFKNSKILGTKFRKLNFEFVHIKKMSFRDCRLPFQSLPYMIGGFNYLKNNNERVFFKSNTKHNRKLIKEDYIQLIPYMEAFYQKTNNHFPLANIYIYKNDFEKAYIAILDGINYSISIEQYRLVQHYCSLFLETPEFTIQQRAHLSQEVLKIINPYMVDIKNNSASKYLLNLRNKLTYYSEDSCAIVSIKTNIPTDRTDKVNAIIESFEPLFINQGFRYHYEIRHNSPYEIAIMLLDNLPNILSVLASVASIAASIATFKSLRKENKKGKDNDKEKSHNETSVNINNVTNINVTNVTNNLLTLINKEDIDINIDITKFD